jgi:transposase
MQIARIGLDLAKYVFEIHGVDAHGKTVPGKTLRRHAVSKFFANLPPCLVDLEASNGAHFWAKAGQGLDLLETRGWVDRSSGVIEA